MAGYKLNINLNSNGQGEIWTVEYSYTGPEEEKTIKLTTEYESYKDLDEMLEVLLIDLTK